MSQSAGSGLAASTATSSLLHANREPAVPGLHITDRQARLYMTLRQTTTQTLAAAKASFSAATGRRLDQDPRLPSRKKVPRGRRPPYARARLAPSFHPPALDNREMAVAPHHHGRALAPSPGLLGGEADEKL